MEKEAKSGILHVQKGSGLVKKIQKRYAALFRRSAHGVARLEIYDSKDTFDKRAKGAKKSLISLESCASIDKNVLNEGKKAEYIILLTFKDNKEQILLAENEEDLQDWYSVISNVIFGGLADLQDNMIYQQYEEGYDVTIKQNDVVSKLDLHGSYFLFVSNEDVELREKSNKHVVARWPLQLLRKYGRDKQEFSLEAGRRCSTGPGMFYFITDHYNAIFQDVDNKVKNLAERGRAHSTSSTKMGPTPNFPPNPPESPLPTSPLPPLSPIGNDSVYDDPLDMRKSRAKEEESIYNEPVNMKATRKQKAKPSSSPKHRKPEGNKTSGDGKLTPHNKTDGKKWQPFSGGKKEGKKDKKTKNVPDRAKLPPGQIQDATYAEALPIGGGVDEAYGHLNFDSRGPAANGGTENAYDSLNVPWSGGKQPPNADSEYATAGDINNRFKGLSTEESMYDKVKR